MKKITTKQIAIGGALLAVMIISQFFKTTSVFITGPIVNAVLIIATLTLGLTMGIILSIIAPISAFFITQPAPPAPMAVVPHLMIPAIALGNIVLCVCVYLFYKHVKKPFGLPIGLVVGSVLKALFMGAVISNFILVRFVTMPKPEALKAAQVMFSTTQLFTALIASAVVMLIWISAGKYLLRESK